MSAYHLHADSPNKTFCSLQRWMTRRREEKQSAVKRILFEPARSRRSSHLAVRDIHTFHYFCSPPSLDIQKNKSTIVQVHIVWDCATWILLRCRSYRSIEGYAGQQYRRIVQRSSYQEDRVYYFVFSSPLSIPLVQQIIMLWSSISSAFGPPLSFVEHRTPTIISRL